MDKSKIRLPKTELSEEATARIAELSARDHHPSAAALNIAKTRELLRKRLAKARPATAK